MSMAYLLAETVNATLAIYGIPLPKPNTTEEEIAKVLAFCASVARRGDHPSTAYARVPSELRWW